MSRGLYSLTSGMLTEQRKIDISSNNIANMNTAGYKKEQAITTSFGEMLIKKYRQRGTESEAEMLSSISAIRAMAENNTVFTQGTISETGSNTDFAILGNGFFSIDRGGKFMYTRNGSFSIDAEGYLVLENYGRVQGDYGDISIGTDKFDFSDDGNIIVDGEVIDRIAVYDFPDYSSLKKNNEGMFTSDVDPDIVEYPKIMNKTIEKSNVDVTEELTGIMSSQRALQTSSQALKMYDLIQEQAVTEIGKL
jgi:flagellar basal-body rod protein FlgG